jgi:uncharacterized membrane protein YdjX (TVP38/TMEM64 family)
MLHTKYVNLFTCSGIIVSIIVLLLIGSSFKSHYLGFVGDISVSNCFVLLLLLLCKAYNALCKSSPKGKGKGASEVVPAL